MGSWGRGPARAPTAVRLLSSQAVLHRLLATATLLLLAPQPQHAPRVHFTCESSVAAGRSGDASPFVLPSERDPGRPSAPLGRAPLAAAPKTVTRPGAGALARTVADGRREDAPRRTVRRLPGRHIPRMGPDEPPRA